MRPPSSDTLAKAGFVLSLLTFSFFYGYGSRGFGWFPNSILDRVWNQTRPLARAVIGEWWTSDNSERYSYDREGIQVFKPEKVQDGTILTSISQDGEPRIRLINTEGKILHRWRLNPAELFPEQYTSFFGLNSYKPLKVVALTREGDLTVGVDGGPMAQVDACGEVYWKVDGPLHHKVHQAQDGSYWALTKDTSTLDYPGLRSSDLLQTTRRSWEGVRHDIIVHISDRGLTLNKIKILDVLMANGLEKYIARMLAFTNDITHANDVEPLPDSIADEYPTFKAGDLLVSLRTLNLVFVFDPVTKDIKWYRSDSFLGQHDPDFIGEGWIGIFDNRYDGTVRGAMLGGSRIVAVQPHTNTTKVLFEPDDRLQFYTPFHGHWQILENGNYFLVASITGRALEVTPEGRKVWEWVAPSGSEGQPITARVRDNRYSFSEKRIASWECSPSDELNRN